MFKSKYGEHGVHNEIWDFDYYALPVKLVLSVFKKNRSRTLPNKKPLFLPIKNV